MPNLIVKTAIHDLVRLDRGFEIKVAEKPLDVNETTQRVIDTLHDLYGQRTSKSHGKFAANEDNYPTQTHLRKYVEKVDDFTILTTNMMETLKKEAGHKGAAGGGHVFFAHFKRDNRDYLLVAILTDKLGAAINQDLGVDAVKHLDIDGFRFAGRINITGWVENEERYLSFLKGKGNIAEYFQEFLGCDTSVQEREDTKTLVSALKAFADAQAMKADVREDFLKRAKDICDRYARAHEEMSFDAFANELLPKEPAAVLKVLSDPNLKLNDNFVPHRPSLNRLTKIQSKTKLWTLEFERDALTAGKIRYDRDAKTLTISDLPASLVQDLEDEHRNAEGDV